MTSTATAAVLEAPHHELEPEDTTDLRVLESVSTLAPGSDQADRTHRHEAALVEYLLFGPNGSAFSDNPAIGLGAEDRGWSRSAMRGVFADLYHRQRLMDYLWWLYQVADPVAKNIVNTYTFFVVGGGCTVSFVNAADGTNERRAKAWRKLAARIDWKRKVRAAVKATALFGEAFFLTFPRRGPIYEVLDGGDRIGRAVAERSSATVETGLSVLNSGDVERVVFRDGNPDDVRAYVQQTADGQRRAIDARDVVHLTFDTLPNSVRGHPLLLVVLQQLYYYRAWLTNRHWLNMVRARVPLVMRRKTGGQTAIRALAAKYGKLPPPGTVWFLPGSVEAEFPSHNVGAADARDDGKQILRTIAMGVQLPEFLVTADASNANYSSSVVAESPAMRMFADLQDLVEIQLAKVVARLMDIDDPSEVEVAFPRVERNLKARVDAFHLGFTDGAVSARTYTEEGFGRPWEGPDGERARLEAEGVVIDPTAGGAPRLPGGAPPAEPGTPPEPAEGGSEPGKGRSTPPGQAE